MIATATQLILPRCGFKKEHQYCDDADYDREVSTESVLRSEDGIHIATLLKNVLTLHTALPSDWPAVNPPKRPNAANYDMLSDWPPEIHPLIEEMDRIQTREHPEAHQPYTHFTVNYNRRVHSHVDHLKRGTMGCIAVVRARNYVLIYPEFRVAIRPEVGDAIIFNGHEYHANFHEPETMSFVAYTRELKK